MIVINRYNNIMIVLEQREMYREEEKGCALHN